MVSTVHRLTTEAIVRILNSKAEAEEDSVTSSAGSVDETTTAAASAGGVEEAAGGGEQQGSAGHRRRRTAASHHVDLVAVDPPVRDDRLRTAIVATNPGKTKSKLRLYHSALSSLA